MSTPSRLLHTLHASAWALLVLSAPLAQAQQATRPLNDTGITFCGEATSVNNAPCVGTEPAGQDAHYGRDAAAAAGQISKLGGGEAGFDFTALDASGQDTAPSSGATPHPCVRDNVTGLWWEVKTDDGGLRDQDWRYTWYDPASPDGNPGTASGTTNCHTAGRCDTSKYVADVNAAGLCGKSDWRMPTVKELEGIANLNRTNPAIDPLYFPNTPSSHFWSGSPYAGSSYYAFYVSFNLGDAYYLNRYYSNSVRLVRGGQ